MRRRAWRRDNVFPLILLPAVVAALIYVGATRQSEARSLDLPPVPHEVQGREACLACHGPGSGKAVPADHAGRAESTCTGCHQAAAQQGPAQAPTIQPASPAGTSSNEGCLACHQGKVSVTLGNEVVDASIDAKVLSASVHGRLSCTACHPDKTTGYPHPQITAMDRRTYATAAAAECADCHQGTNEKYAGSVHGDAVRTGNLQAATCTDCHGTHDVAKTDRLARKSDLCSSCHKVVTETYRDSVHGQLVSSGRADAATCIDCHTRDKSGHSLTSVGDPAGPTADKNVPETCGKCHYEALQTYNSTFHGRAMRLGVLAKAPNCVDCHGAYGVQRVHASEAPLDETKVATACAKCHEGAGDSFVEGWMGHEEPSPSWFPAVFFTERFLFFLTSSVVAFGILHVELDLLRWLVRRRKGGEKKGGK